MKRYRSQKGLRAGFTLPEVLATVLIVSVLAAVAIPLYNSSKSDAQEKVCASHVAAIANAQSKYRFDNGSFTTTGTALVGHGIAEFPKCPTTNTVYKLTEGTGGITKSVKIECDGTGKHTSNTKTISVP